MVVVLPLFFLLFWEWYLVGVGLPIEKGAFFLPIFPFYASLPTAGQGPPSPSQILPHFHTSHSQNKHTQRGGEKYWHLSLRQFFQSIHGFLFTSFPLLLSLRRRLLPRWSLSSHPFLLLLLLLFSPFFTPFSFFADSQSFIGVNYGQLADNLPPPASTANLLRSTSIAKIRLYGADPLIIKALENSGIGIVIGVANGDIPALASNPNSAAQWINTNVSPYYPASNIVLVTVGNEVMSSMDQNLISQLVPAMQNVQNALSSANLGRKVKVSTVHSMAVLSQSDPPSSGRFNPVFEQTMKAVVEFLKENESAFAINPYPFFAYQSDPRPETLAFCLFQPNSGRVDSGTGIKYMNMFDAQVSDPLHIV